MHTADGMEPLAGGGHWLGTTLQDELVYAGAESSRLRATVEKLMSRVESYEEENDRLVSDLHDAHRRAKEYKQLYESVERLVADDAHACPCCSWEWPADAQVADRLKMEECARARLAAAAGSRPQSGSCNSASAWVATGSGVAHHARRSQGSALPEAEPFALEEAWVAAGDAAAHSPSGSAACGHDGSFQICSASGSARCLSETAGSTAAMPLPGPPQLSSPSGSALSLRPGASAAVAARRLQRTDPRSAASSQQSLGEDPQGSARGAGTAPPNASAAAFRRGAAPASLLGEDQQVSLPATPASMVTASLPGALQPSPPSGSVTSSPAASRRGVVAAAASVVAAERMQRSSPGTFAAAATHGQRRNPRSADVHEPPSELRSGPARSDGPGLSSGPLHTASMLLAATSETTMLPGKMIMEDPSVCEAIAAAISILSKVAGVRTELQGRGTAYTKELNEAKEELNEGEERLALVQESSLGGQVRLQGSLVLPPSPVPFQQNIVSRTQEPGRIRQERCVAEATLLPCGADVLTDITASHGFGSLRSSNLQHLKDALLREHAVLILQTKLKAHVARLQLEAEAKRTLRPVPVCVPPLDFASVVIGDDFADLDEDEVDQALLADGGSSSLVSHAWSRAPGFGSALQFVKSKGRPQSSPIQSSTTVLETSALKPRGQSAGCVRVQRQPREHSAGSVAVREKSWKKQAMSFHYHGTTVSHLAEDLLAAKKATLMPPGLSERTRGGAALKRCSVSKHMVYPLRPHAGGFGGAACQQQQLLALTS